MLNTLLNREEESWGDTYSMEYKKEVKQYKKFKRKIKKKKETRVPIGDSGLG